MDEYYHRGGADFVQNLIPMPEVWTNIVAEGGADFVQNSIPKPEVWTNVVTEGYVRSTEK